MEILKDIGIIILMIIGGVFACFIAFYPTGGVSSPRKSKNKPKIVQRSNKD